jgi:hypothetical protein
MNDSLFLREFENVFMINFMSERTEAGVVENSNILSEENRQTDISFLI